MAASVVQVDPILVVVVGLVAPTKPVAAVVAVEQAMLVAVVAAAGQATAAADFAAYFAAEQVAGLGFCTNGSHWFYWFVAPSFPLLT